MKPVNMPRTNSRKPNSQLISRGLRNAPVKKTRIMCTNMPARKISAAQWWICRISRPPRTSKLMSSVEAYASDIRMPCIGTYEPWYTTSFMLGWKNSVRYTPVRMMMMKL